MSTENIPMPGTDTNSHAFVLASELAWLQSLLLLRGQISFEGSALESDFENLKPPDIATCQGTYTHLVQKYKMGFRERLVLILSLVPHLKPSALDVFLIKNKEFDGPFTEFGGVTGSHHKGFLPTGETAVFLLSGNDIKKRLEVRHIFTPAHYLFGDNIVQLDSVGTAEPKMSGILSVNREFLNWLTYEEVYQPDFDFSFPAKRITTQQEWEDLILSDHVMEGIDELKNWLKFGKRLKDQYDFGRKIKKGFKVLFSGPPGTGKTLTACLLGKNCQMDVYRIDLSQVVSKYIGETEKNLSSVFDIAERKGWILFFDEADALFGKRSQTTDSHDRYANQEVSYLLQRIEDYDGLVILSTNFKNNIDEAFFRRFQLILDFEKPDFSQRLMFWETALTDDFRYADDVDLDELAEIPDLTGASIISILHFCILKLMGRSETEIRKDDIWAGIKIEKIKQGKSIL